MPQCHGIAGCHPAVPPAVPALRPRSPAIAAFQQQMIFERACTLQCVRPRAKPCLEPASPTTGPLRNPEPSFFGCAAGRQGCYAVTGYTGAGALNRGWGTRRSSLPRQPRRRGESRGPSNHPSKIRCIYGAYFRELRMQTTNLPCNPGSGDCGVRHGQQRVAEILPCQSPSCGRRITGRPSGCHGKICPQIPSGSKSPAQPRACTRRCA